MKVHEHPFFPLEGNERLTASEQHELRFIKLQRFEPSGAKYHPRKFTPDELADTDSIWELFGGGNYEVLAYDGTHIRDRRRIAIAGTSKPLVFEESASPAAAAPAPSAPAARDPVQTAIAIAGALTPIVTLFLTSLRDGRAADEARQDRRDQLQRERDAAHLEAMAKIQAAQVQSMADVYKALSSNTGNGAETYQRGLETGLEMARAAAPSADDDDPTKTIQAFVQGANLLESMTAKPAAAATQALANGAAGAGS